MDISEGRSVRNMMRNKTEQKSKEGREKRGGTGYEEMKSKYTHNPHKQRTYRSWVILGCATVLASMREIHIRVIISPYHIKHRDFIGIIMGDGMRVVTTSVLATYIDIGIPITNALATIHLTTYNDVLG